MTDDFTNPIDEDEADLDPSEVVGDSVDDVATDQMASDDDPDMPRRSTPLDSVIAWWTTRSSPTALVTAAALAITFYIVANAVHLSIFPSQDLVFDRTTPTGGDFGAHVWGPAFLRDVLLPSLRFNGWTMDWYAGMPAYNFYMVLPA
ncbi:MAG: hypothetical protein CSA55_06190, partial [Ilumatobacter coccineus]